MDAHASFSIAVLAQDGRDDLRQAGAQEGSRPPCLISCNLSKRNEAPLNLGIMCTIGPLRFIGFPNRFRTDNPGIERSMMEATPGRLSEMLMEGKRDIAVMAQPDSFDGRLVEQRLYPERFVVVFRPVTALNRATALLGEAGRDPGLRAIRSHRWPQDADAVLPARNVGSPRSLNAPRRRVSRGPAVVRQP